MFPERRQRWWWETCVRIMNNGCGLWWTLSWIWRSRMWTGRGSRPRPWGRRISSVSEALLLPPSLSEGRVMGWVVFRRLDSDDTLLRDEECATRLVHLHRHHGRYSPRVRLHQELGHRPDEAKRSVWSNTDIVYRRIGGRRKLWDREGDWQYKFAGCIGPLGGGDTDGDDVWARVARQRTQRLRDRDAS